jgi:PAS domain S-box-containing protein
MEEIDSILHVLMDSLIIEGVGQYRTAANPFTAITTNLGSVASFGFDVAQVILVIAVVLLVVLRVRAGRQFERIREQLFEQVSRLLVSGHPLEEGLRGVFEVATPCLLLKAAQLWTCRSVSEVLRRAVDSPEPLAGLEIDLSSDMPKGKEHVTLAFDFPPEHSGECSFEWNSTFVSIQYGSELVAILCLQSRTWFDPWGIHQRCVRVLAEVVALVLLHSARKTLERQAQLKSTAIDSAAEAIAVLDSQRRVLYSNSSFRSMFGLPTGRDLSGEHWSQLFDDSEFTRVHSACSEIDPGAERFTLEATALRYDCTTFPVQLSITDLGEDGFVCSFRDISIRKRVEESAEQVVLFATLNPSPVFRVDRLGYVLMANPAAMELFYLGKGVSTHISVLGEAVRTLDLERLIEQSGVETVVVDAGERSFQFVVRGVSHLSAAQFYGTDVSDLKRKGEELRESQTFLRTIIDTDPNLIFVKDRQGRYQLVNQALAEAYGTTVEEMLGMTDADFCRNQDEAQHFRYDDLEVIDKEQEKRIPEEIVTDAEGKARYFQTVKRPLSNREGGDVQVLGVATDITEQKRLQEQLMHADKMEAIGRLAGGVAHDFNNILTAILGFTSLLKLRSEFSQEVEQTAGFIEAAAEKASQLTQKLLGFARKGKHRNIPINLHDAVNEAVTLVSRTFETNIALKCRLSAGSPHILGDPIQIQQILLNLAINARDSMSGEGSGGEEVLTISTRNLSSNEVPEAIRKVAQEFVELTVRDTGCGMSREVQEQIFEPFFTTKSEGKGTGMGLSMVYGIVKNHGGAIAVESEPGEGALFSVFFPVTEVVVEQAEKTEVVSVGGPLAARLGGHSQILLVDDHKVIRDVTSRMLSSLGYTVTTAADGKEALQYYRTNRDRIDLVILDMVMPRMSAEECFGEIRKINPDVKVVLSTGYVNNHRVQEILDQGMAGFVQKPYQLEELSKVVEKALE